MQTAGSRIKEARIAARLTMYETATAAGISRADLRAIEDGTRTLTPFEALSLARLLHIHPQVLLAGTEADLPPYHPWRVRD